MHRVWCAGWQIGHAFEMRGGIDPMQRWASVGEIRRIEAPARRRLRARHGNESNGGHRRRRPLGERKPFVEPPGAPNPVHAAWTGALLAPRDGLYRFVLDTSGETAVRIDGALALSQTHPEVEQRLAEGLHTLQIDTNLTGAPLLQLRWQSPGEPLAPIPAEVLFRTAAVHGMTAAYRGRDQTTERIELFPYHFFFPERIPGTYSVRWHGRLEVPPGGYVLRPESNRPVIVRDDGTPWPPRKPLSAGSHDLEIELSDIAGAPRLRLYWERPGRERSLIPPEAFSPSH